MSFDISPYLSGGRHVVTAAAAFGAGIGVHSLYGVSSDQITEGFDHIFKGLNELSIGVGVLAPVAMGAWATVKGLMSSKVKDVRDAHPEVVAAAVAKAAPAVILDAAATVPGVTKIVASPAMADATASPKVVS